MKITKYIPNPLRGFKSIYWTNKYDEIDNELDVIGWWYLIGVTNDNQFEEEVNEVIDKFKPLIYENPPNWFLNDINEKVFDKYLQLINDIKNENGNING